MRALLKLMGSRLPQTEGTVVAEVSAPVTIRRDRWGIVYIEAQNELDAMFGLGFAQGQDRAFQLEVYLRIARGMLAELVGKDGLESDRLARRLGWHRTAQAQFASLPVQLRAEHQAFARGINAARTSGEKPHEVALLGGSMQAFEASDPLALLQFLGFALSSNWDAELARLQVLQSDGPEALMALEAADARHLALDASQLGRLASDVSLLAAAEQFALSAAEATGAAKIGGASNAWVLAGSRTGTGRPLLASDPHLGPTVPAPWYLAQVRGGALAMNGAFFPGQPAFSIGHNARVAFGITAGHGDNTDLFIEKLGPDGTTALRGERFVPCEVREEVIHVKGKPDVVERVVVTPTGPVVTPVMHAGGTALSLRGTWMAVRPIRAYGLARAQSVAEVRALFDGYPAESENRHLADVDGNICWQLVGDLPVRKKGHGLLPMPAWDLDAGWEDAPVPFARMPSIVNPPDGFVFSANGPPPHSSDHLGADWLDTGRQERIRELIGARSDWNVESTLAAQLDRTTIYWRVVQPALLAALEPSPKGGEKAAGLLRGWDGVVAPGSAAASVYEVLFAELMCRAMKAKAPRAWKHAVGVALNDVLEHGIMALRRARHLARLIAEQPAGWFPNGWASEICAALVETQRILTARAGSDPARWAWGQVRPLTLVHPAGKVPVLKHAFNLGPIAVGGDGSTLAQASVPFDHPLSNPIGVANLRTVIDVGNWEASRYVLAGGQSGNPCSPHYDDQLPLWERGEAIGMAWALENVRRAAVATLQLAPKVQ